LARPRLWVSEQSRKWRAVDRVTSDFERLHTAKAKRQSATVDDNRH
jgi:hypothetical protein